MVNSHWRIKCERSAFASRSPARALAAWSTSCPWTRTSHSYYYRAIGSISQNPWRIRWNALKIGFQIELWIRVRSRIIQPYLWASAAKCHQFTWYCSWGRSPGFELSEWNSKLISPRHEYFCDSRPDTKKKGGTLLTNWWHGNAHWRFWWK